MINIKTLNQFSSESSVYRQIESIFFEASSLKEFSSPERKSAFFKRWCGDYAERFPQTFYLMLEGEKLLGYLSGCLDSKTAGSFLEVPGYCVFNDLFDEFPAHLHINFHQDCRGRGLGSHLMQAYIEELDKKGIRGVHLVTSPGAQNITFYSRLGFNHQVVRSFKEMQLLFMGRPLC